MQKAISPPSRSRTWRPQPFIRDPRLRWGIIALTAIYLILAVNTLNLNWTRIARGIDRGVRIFSGFLQPDFLTRWPDVQAGVLESLTMTIVATVLGVILSIPVGFGAARNVAPLPIFLFCRAIVSITRTFQEVIIAIVFVIMIGFGPLAGALTLSLATIGFMAKLLAEDIEEIDPAQVEAIRATGAGWFKVMSYAVVPQIKPRLVGLSVYRTDINFRESAILGVVGAGGIGATLQIAFGRYEYEIAAAILLIIVGLVMAMELASGFVRKRLQ
jgi:phosphonate transport system permease protein